MKQKLPAIDSQELLRFLKGLGFVVIRTIHRKIIREDLEMSLEDFLELYSDSKRK